MFDRLTISVPDALLEEGLDWRSRDSVTKEEKRLFQHSTCALAYVGSELVYH